jgi:hypothetical protein
MSTAGGPSATAAGSKSSDSSTSTTYTNSHISGNTIITASGKDTTLEGAVLEGNDIAMNVGGDLTMTSLQDTSNSKGSSSGFSMGGGSVSSAGINAGQSSGESKWVNEQTGITGSNSVTVNVEGTSTLTGALIANATRDESGNLINEGDNLALTTTSLITNDLKDTQKNTSTSMGISYSGFDTRTDEEKKENPDAPTGGTTTVNAAYNGSESEQATRATIGQGTITVKDGTEVTANRDLDKAQEITMEHTIGGLNANLTVDNRMFSEAGQNQIKDDVYKASAITNAIEQIVTTDKAGITDFFKETGKNYNVYEGMKKELANNPELAAQLQDPNLSPEKKQEMLQTVADTVAKSLGYKTNEVNMVSTDETGANGTQVRGHYGENGETYVNDKTNGSTEDLIATVGHETQHSMDDQRQELKLNDADQNNYADNFGEDVAFYTGGALAITHDASLASTNNHQPVQSIEEHLMVQNNNQEFAGLDKSKGDDYTYDEAKVLVTKYSGMAMYEDSRIEGGYGVGPIDGVARLNSLGEDLPKEHFLNKFPADVGQGVVGLANGLNRLNNMDTSNMKPVERAVFEKLMIKVNTVPAISESELNPMDNSREQIFDALKGER